MHICPDSFLQLELGLSIFSSWLTSLLFPSVIFIYQEVIDKKTFSYSRFTSLGHYHVYNFRVVLAYSGGKGVGSTSSCTNRCHGDQTSCFIRAVTMAGRDRPPLQMHNASGAGQEGSGSLSRSRSIGSFPSSNRSQSPCHVLHPKDCKTSLVL